MIAILIGVVLLFVNGFFVATEFAMIASRSAKLETLADRGNRRATLALTAMRRLPLQLAGAQLGITMTSLGLGFVAEPAVDRAIHTLIGDIGVLPGGVAKVVSVVLALLIVVFFHMVIGEAVPKNIAISAPETTLLTLVAPYQLYLAAFRPVVVGLNWSANVGVRLLGIEPRSAMERTHSADEIAAMLDASAAEGLIAEFEHDLLAGALDFAERAVADLMTPWARVTTVTAETSVEELEEAVVRSGHTRLPVVGPQPESIRGFVHAKDLLDVHASQRARPLPAEKLRRYLRATPDTAAERLLLRMRFSRIHLAVVFDDDNALVGLVTLEDLLEELVGDIRDETDPDPPNSSPS